MQDFLANHKLYFCSLIFFFLQLDQIFAAGKLGHCSLNIFMCKCKDWLQYFTASREDSICSLPKHQLLAIGAITFYRSS